MSVENTVDSMRVLSETVKMQQDIIERQSERITRLEEAHPFPTGPVGGPDVSYLRATWQDPSSQ